jgi:hypothetical protein
MSYIVHDRDPFSRIDYVRRRVETTDCAFCGQPGRFQYGYHPDAEPAPLWRNTTFCGIDCARSYA